MFIFLNSSASIGRGSVVRLGHGMEVGDNLIASLGLGLRLSLDIGMGIGMDAGGVVNIFSTCCLDIL